MSIPAILTCSPIIHKFNHIPSTNETFLLLVIFIFRSICGLFQFYMVRHFEYKCVIPSTIFTLCHRLFDETREQSTIAHVFFFVCVFDFVLSFLSFSLFSSTQTRVRSRWDHFSCVSSLEWPNRWQRNQTRGYKHKRKFHNLFLFHSTHSYAFKFMYSTCIDCVRLKTRSPNTDEFSATEFTLRDSMWFQLDFRLSCSGSLFEFVEATPI